MSAVMHRWRCRPMTAADLRMIERRKFPKLLICWLCVDPRNLPLTHVDQDLAPRIGDVMLCKDCADDLKRAERALISTPGIRSPE